MPDIVIASHNAGKLREFVQMRQQLSVAFPALRHLIFIPITRWTNAAPEETGASFAANALIKARAAAALTGLPAIADDSGLEVSALNGAPGIFSARYAGIDASDRENNAQLLRALESTPATERQARFVCALALARSAEDTQPLTAEGTWTGEILMAPQGAQGFGYDSLFYIPGRKASAAQLPAELKNRISHRALALANLLSQLGAEPI